jgi:hypothetical protein
MRDGVSVRLQMKVTSTRQCNLLFANNTREAHPASLRFGRVKMDPLLASSSSSKLSGTIGVAEGLPGDDIQLIASPVTLPNGTVVPNRLVKVSTSRLVVCLTISVSAILSVTCCLTATGGYGGRDR